MSLILPIKNEAAHLPRALDAIDAQSYSSDRMEIIVVDGGSTDGTLELVQHRMTRDPRIQLLGEPGVNTPLAMNMGLRASSGDLIAKVDGHGWMSPDFVVTAANALMADPSVGCIGGRIVPVAETAVEQANSYARFSRLGVGGGIYTAGPVAHDAETVQCGVYRRSVLLDLGGFDPVLMYGEDEELNYRVREAGWRIMFHPGMEFSYRVRPTIASLFRQYFRYGKARIAVIRKHPHFARPKHVIPAVLVLMLSGSLLWFILAPELRVLGLAPWGAYLLALLAGATSLAIKHRYRRIDLIVFSLIALHIGYGLGTLAGLWSEATRRGRSGHASS